MKNLLLAFALLWVVTVKAQETSSSFKKETVEFLKLTGAGAAFEDAIGQIGAMVAETNKAAFTKEANGTLVGLYDKMANLYMKEFTQTEIQELIRFYHSDLGKKLAEKQLSLMKKAMSFGQAWGMEVQAIAAKY